MSIKGWIWKSAVAGFAGSVVHLAFMYVRLKLGILPTFQPYPAFQATLSHWAGTNVPAIVPWLLSFLNGMTILGFLFARLKRLLPGRTGASKGLTLPVDRAEEVPLCERDAAMTQDVVRRRYKEEEIWQGELLQIVVALHFSVVAASSPSDNLALRAVDLCASQGLHEA
jgi:hypothetical protein